MPRAIGEKREKGRERGDRGGQGREILSRSRCAPSFFPTAVKRAIVQQELLSLREAFPRRFRFALG